jgi:hypothetical protein
LYVNKRKNSEGKISFQKAMTEAGGMSRVVEHLPSKSEGSEFNPRTVKKKKAMAENSYKQINKINKRQGVVIFLTEVNNFKCKGS